VLDCGAIEGVPHRHDAFGVFRLGRLMLEDGRELMRVPLGTWLKIEMEGVLGADLATRFSLRVQADGTEAMREFRDLPTPSADFRWMDSLFIVAQGTQKAVFDVREIELVPVRTKSSRMPKRQP